MKTHVSQAGTDWIPKVIPTTAINPDYFFGCKTVQELSEYYQTKQGRGFCASDLIASIVNANDGFSKFPIPIEDWPKVQLALALLGVDPMDRRALEQRGLFMKNRGH